MQNSNVYGFCGFGCTAKMYDLLFQEIKNISPEISLKALENWNMGLGERAPESHYSLQQLAEYFWNKIDNELSTPNAKVHLVGVSMGGFIVQLMAALRPEKISSLTLLCSLGPAQNGFILPQALTEAGLRFFHQLPLEQQASLGTDATVHPLLKSRDPGTYQKIVDYRLQNTAKNVEDLISQNSAALDFLNGKIDYSSISHLPTLILHGFDDRFVSRENAKIFQEKFPKSSVELISETDHFFFMEKPKVVAHSIVQFIQSASVIL